jgi:hypothetical protein
MSDVKITIGQTGAESAAAGVKQLETATRGAATAAQEMTGHSETSAAGFTHFAHAAQAADGSVRGIAALLRALIPEMKGMENILPAAGLAFAAFEAWKKVFEGIEEIQSASFKRMHDTASGNATAGVDSLKEAYKRLEDEIKNAEKETQTFFEGQKKLSEAGTNMAVASLERQRQAELVGTRDETGRKAIDARYDLAIANVKATGSENQSTLEVGSLESKLRDAKRDRDTALEKQLDWEQTLARYEKADAVQKKAMRNEMDANWTKRGEGMVGEKWSSYNQASAASIKEAGAGVLSAHEEALSQEDLIQKLTDQLAAAKMQQKTQSFTSQTNISKDSEKRANVLIEAFDEDYKRLGQVNAAESTGQYSVADIRKAKAALTSDLKEIFAELQTLPADMAVIKDQLGLFKNVIQDLSRNSNMGQ